MSDWLLPSTVATPHLQILVKTHKQNNPVRLTFSSIGTATRNLSSLIDYIYLKPAIQNFSPRRLQDTREAAIFINEINKYIWDNNIEDKPIIFALDVENFFPSVKLQLALPAIKQALKQNNITNNEINAVLNGIRVLRNGSFFMWKENYWQQISGCPLGDVDSCSYTDLAMVYYLQSLIPATESATNINLDWFKIYRDDGLGIIFALPEKVIEILHFFNRYSEDIKWTIPKCSVCNTYEVICPHYTYVEFLDTKISWEEKQKGSKLL